MSSSSKRDYKWSFKLYPDSTDYDCKEVISKLKQIFHEWAYILHDKDLKTFDLERLRVCSFDRTRNKGAFRATHRKLHIPLAKPHYHFYGSNGKHCNISKQSLVKSLCLPYSYNFRPHDIEPCWSWYGCLNYSIHRNAPDKFQYKENRVKTNIREFHEIVTQNRTMTADLKTLYEILDEAKRGGRIIPYYELVRIMCVRGCTLQLARPSMVERISKSYQYYEMGRVVE